MMFFLLKQRERQTERETDRQTERDRQIKKDKGIDREIMFLLLKPR